MNRLIKTILIISIAIFGAGFLSASPAKANEVDELVVEYWSDAGSEWLLLAGPIFSETNFLPGQSVTRLVRVTNNSVQMQRIAVEAINQTNVGDLASQLDIIIKEGGSTIYNKTLKQFFDDKEIYLSSLAGSGGQTQYNFNISFKFGAGDNYQGKSAGFNLIIGLEGTEGGLTLPGPGGSASGGLSPGLTISNQSNPIATDVSVLITWNTSYPATSQVIYAIEGEKHILDLTDTTGTPPKYGYARTTPEYDTPANINGKISHLITISDLTPGTTYYYRAVSHGSLAITQEYSFTTLTPEEAAAATVAAPAEVGETGATLPLQIPSTEVSKETTLPTEAALGNPPQVPPQVQAQPRRLAAVAAVADMVLKDISQSTFKSIPLVISLIILFLLLSKEISRKKKKI